MLEQECNSESAPDTRTRWEKLMAQVFPAKRLTLPDAPKGFGRFGSGDCIWGHSITKLSWPDRIRVLLTGVIITEWATVTENEVGATVTNATVYVGRSCKNPFGMRGTE